MSLKNTLPEAHFGPIGKKPARWQDSHTKDPDDEELAKTPYSVKAILGFDPKKIKTKRK